MTKQISVVGAVVIRHGKVLCAQRGPGGDLPGLWEFPGGKVEPGETARQALEREIREELHCDIEVGEEVTTTNHDYDFGRVSLTTFYSRLISGDVRLTEHSDLRWLEPSRLTELDWAPADQPAVERIIGTLAS